MLLFGHEEPRFDASFAKLERTELADGAWIEVVRGWLRGDATVFETLRREVRWRSEERNMYDRIVEVPRQYAALALGELPHSVLEPMRVALSDRYETHFDRVSVALYRDGRDSVAWHGDYVARRLPNALVATVSVGGARKFMLRPKGGGASLSTTLGFGDLIVMGGTCQRTWDHCIPKVAFAEPRIAIMYRPTWRDPDTGATG